MTYVYFFFQAEDGIRDLVRSRGLGDVYKRQPPHRRPSRTSGGRVRHRGLRPSLHRPIGHHRDTANRRRWAHCFRADAPLGTRLCGVSRAGLRHSEIALPFASHLGWVHCFSHVGHLAAVPRMDRRNSSSELGRARRSSTCHGGFRR